jgi:hypothetical protein
MISSVSPYWLRNNEETKGGDGYEEGNKKGERKMQLFDIRYSAVLLQIVEGCGRLPQLRNWGG